MIRGDEAAEPINLVNVAKGKAVQAFEDELMKVLENILDDSTEAEAKRSIILTFEFMPHGDRKASIVLVRAVSKLAPSRAEAQLVHLGRMDGGIPTALADDPNQPPLFPVEKPPQELKS
jgi:hypothetical protein